MRCLLGIDPGYDRCGWAVLEYANGKQELVASGCIETHKQTPLFQRYDMLQQEFSKILERYHPNECGIESIFFSNNTSTAIQIGEVRGILLSNLFLHNVKVTNYTPTQIKSAVTGNGK